VEANLVNTKQTLLECISYLKTAKIIAVDLETSSLEHWKEHIAGFALAGPKKSFYIPVRHTGHEESPEVLDQLPIDLVKRAVQGILSLPCPKVFHHGKFDLRFLWNEGYTVEGSYHDTMLVAFALDETRHTYGLKPLAVDYIEKDAADEQDKVKEYFKKHKLDSYGQIPIEVLWRYACKDVEYTFKLFKILYPKIIADHKELGGKRASLKDLYDNERRLSQTLARMEFQGVPVDIEYLKGEEKRLAKEDVILEKAIIEAAGCDINLNSPKQLKELLYVKLKLPVPHKTKPSKTNPEGQPSTDKAALEVLEKLNPIAGNIAKLRRNRKFNSTFIRGILERHNDGLIHCDFRQNGTVTGRLSSAQPNLQNLPREEEDPEKRLTSIRRAFIRPSEDYRLLILDYSQIEYKVLAHYAKDTTMIEKFKEGLDFHTSTGMLTPL